MTANQLLAQVGDEASLKHVAKKVLTAQLTAHPAAETVPGIKGIAEAFRR